jgi:tRNA(fMet)-specific endonuclease VapC
MPASGRFLLDTNIVIALLEGNEAVLSSLDLAWEVYIPPIVKGELFVERRNQDAPPRTRAR